VPVLGSSACYSYFIKQHSPIWGKITQFGQKITWLFSAICFYAQAYFHYRKGHASGLAGGEMKTGM